MQDEPRKTPDEGEVEGHLKAKGPAEDPGLRIARSEDEDLEVEAHLKAKAPSEEPGKVF